jgi:N-dimethylarginine dimethylaminohydrolase
MCPPTAYDIEYEINPWMHMDNQPSKKLAHEQWEKVYKTYVDLGVAVERIDQIKGLPDMVFTANGGIVRGKTFISGNYRYKERKGEEIHFQRWFKEHGYEVKTLQHYQGGEGDALFYKGTLYCGWGFRSELESHKEISDIFSVPSVSLKLIDPYFYDFDMTFCPLGDRGVFYYPGAYDEESKEKAAGIEGAIAITKEQAANYICNSVFVNGKLLMDYIDDDLKQKLSKLDIEPILLDMSEFKKAGGGIKCLTLYIEL